MTSQIEIFASQLHFDPYSNVAESPDFIGDILSLFDLSAKQRLRSELRDFAGNADGDAILEKFCLMGSDLIFESADQLRAFLGYVVDRIDGRVTEPLSVKPAK